MVTVIMAPDDVDTSVSEKIAELGGEGKVHIDAYTKVTGAQLKYSDDGGST